jgi:hypothetical protein
MTLTDEQHNAIYRALRPLDRNQQNAFMAQLINLFGDRQSIGDGELYRCLRDLQRRHISMYPERTVGNEKFGKGNRWHK